MQVTRSKLVRGFALGMGIAVWVGACGIGQRVPSPPAIETPPASHEPLKVATAPPFPPFQFKGKQGELEGFDIDLIQALGQQLDRPIELVVMPFGELVPALEAGKVDAAISAIPITKARSQLVDFSRPYLEAGLVIAVQASEREIAAAANLQGKTLAVQLDTAGAAEAIKILGSKLVTFDSPTAALHALLAGKVDAVIHSQPMLLAAIATEDLSGLRLLDPPLTEQPYGIALPLDSPHTEAINQALEALEAQGTYDRIYEKWFGVPCPQTEQ